MTYLVITYLIYIALMVVIIGWAGWHLHHAGRPFIREVFQGELLKADLTNNLLLLGYYLVNIGYSFLVLSRLPAVDSPAEVIGALSSQIGALTGLLALLHYGNLLVFSVWKHFRNA